MPAQEMCEHLNKTPSPCLNECCIGKGLRVLCIYVWGWKICVNNTLIFTWPCSLLNFSVVNKDADAFFKGHLATNENLTVC